MDMGRTEGEIAFRRYSSKLEPILSREMFGFNIMHEDIVRPTIMLGARWVEKIIQFTKFYT